MQWRFSPPNIANVGTLHEVESLFSKEYDSFFLILCVDIDTVTTHDRRSESDDKQDVEMPALHKTVISVLWHRFSQFKTKQSPPTLILLFPKDPDSVPLSEEDKKLREVKREQLMKRYYRSALSIRICTTVEDALWALRMPEIPMHDIEH